MLIVWDAGMEGLSGIPSQKALGQALWDVRFRALPERQRTAALHHWLKQGFLQLLRTGHWQETERANQIDVAHANGHEFVAELTLSVLETPQGRRIVGAVIKPDPVYLPARATQGAYQSLIEHSLQGVVIFQGQRLVYANESAAAITGYAQRELLSFGLADLIRLLQPIHQKLAWGHWRDWLSGRTAPLFQEYRYRHPDGRERWLEIRVTLVSRQGKRALQAAFLDMTAYKAAQEALQRSLDQERRTHALLLSLSHAAQEVLRARTEHEIYWVIGERIVELGYHALILALDSDSEHLEVSFATYTPEMIQDVEALTQIPMLGYRFKMPEDGYYKRIVVERRAIYTPETEQAIAEALPSVKSKTRTLAQILKIKQRIGAPLVVRDQIYGILIVNGSGLREDDVPAIEAFANQAAIALENAHLTAEEERQREALRALSARLVRIQEAEQARIARELHDETGQTLTAMSLHLAQAIQKLEQSPAGTDPKTLEHLVQARALVKQTTRQIREMCFRLRPSILDEMGLVPALRWLTNWFEGQYGIQIAFKARKVDGRLPSEIETTLYRIAQEGLTNAMRYARAHRVFVRLDCLVHAVRLTVQDSGAGFEPSDIVLGESTGLVGMKERVALVKGTLQIDSRPGKGTRVTVEIPLKQG